ncbi:MAG: U32 family peptidase [Defluviitaleaceae bacterium]|nr:U32 family peptidase [Defluviitaleaceae bacterium]
MRFFNGKQIELLAPAGNMAIFTQLLNTNCDAFYLGGKGLNMRLHRKDFNFSDDELIKVVQMANEVDKKIFVTVNSLHDKNEVAQAEKYLQFLAEKVQPHAIIIQDFGILEQAHNLGLEVHASVMANVHNLASINRLYKLGVSRVVLPRELPISYVKSLANTTPMQFEYFVHGDMCIAHGGQCLYSGILLGKSSNRGRCMKPCRWNYKIQANGKTHETFYPMAVKDMYMYEHIPEMIHSGIVAFKIEGRMRDAEYLSTIINAYGDAIDNYIADPLAFNRKKDSTALFENRKRDFSTAYALGVPGLSNINRRWEGTGKFYSTGKPFSLATEEHSITANRTAQIKEYLCSLQSQKSQKSQKSHKIEQAKTSNSGKLKISVKVNDLESAKAALASGADRVFISGDTFLPSKPPTIAELDQLFAENSENFQKIYLSTPRMMFDIDFDEYSHFIAKNPQFTNFLCTNIGTLEFFSEKGKRNLIGDYPLNIYNRQSAEFFLEKAATQHNLAEFTISPEAQLEDVADMIITHGEKANLIVQGSPVVMYFEHDFYQNLDDPSYNGKILLVDDAGFSHPIFKDKKGRNHMTLYKDLCLLPILGELANIGMHNITIEAAHLPPPQIVQLCSTYQQAATDLALCQRLFENLRENNDYSFGGLGFSVGE